MYKRTIKLTRKEYRNLYRLGKINTINTDWYKSKDHKGHIIYTGYQYTDKIHSMFCPFCENLFNLSNELFDFPLKEKTRIHCPNCGLDFDFNSKKDKIFTKDY